MKVYTAVPQGGDPLEDGEVILACDDGEAFEEAIRRKPEARGWIIKLIKVLWTGELEV